MNEKTTKAIHDLKTAIDSFDKLTMSEKQAVITAVFGANAVQKIMMIQNEIYRNRIL